MARFRAYIPILFLVSAAVLSSCDDDCPVCEQPTPRPTGWFAQTAPNEESYFGLHVFDAGTAIAVGSNGYIIRTTDGGDHWTVVTSGSTDRLSDVSFVGNTGWAVGLDSVLLKTTDAGLTWTQQYTGVWTHFRRVHFVDQNTGWIAAAPWGEPGMNGYILKTENGGDSWVVQRTEPSNALCFTDADSGCVGGAGGVYRTTDGGDNWQFVDMGASTSITRLVFVNDLTGWAAARLGFVAKTTDAGRTWTPVECGTDRNINDLFFVDTDRGWYVAGSPPTIAVTVDGGATWNFQTCPADEAIRRIVMAGENTGWIVGYYGTILKTLTGGSN